MDSTYHPPWRGTANPLAAGRDEPYAAAGRAEVLNEAGFSQAEAAITTWPRHAETPLHALAALATQLRLAALHVKDEGLRFGLGSFKALGGAYAVSRVVAQSIAQSVAQSAAQSVAPSVERSVARAVAQEEAPGPAAKLLPDAAELLSGRWRDAARRVTVTCATDGNHGRSVAWGAQLFGCRCVIFIHATVSEGRRDAIAAYGAEVVRVAGNYDDAVRHAEATARAEGWTVVSDTTYEGYRDIPIDVMHGYGVMAREVVRQLGGEPPTHVLVQAGVGAFAASVAAVFWQAWGARRPRLIVVEPQQADCHLQSAQAGRPVAVTGALDTVMAGLACGEVSPEAWTIVSTAADDFIAVHDDLALQGMRVLAEPASGDPPVVAGETGAAGLAVLLAAQADPTLREQLGLSPSSRVLLLNSEGDTDPVIYRQVVGRDARAVRAEGPRQRAKARSDQEAQEAQGTHRAQGPLGAPSARGPQA